MRWNNLFAAFIVGGLGLNASGQDAKKSEAPKSETKRVAKDAKKSLPITAITGADVYTVTKGVIRNAVILIQDGKILRISQDLAIPEGATKIDAAGKVITPGFISISASNVGVRPVAGPGGGGPNANPAQNRVADALNPFDRNIQICLAAGITTACVEVSGGGGGRFGRDADVDLEELFGFDDTRLCPCCGLPILPTEPITPPTPTERTARKSAVLKMSFGDTSGMLVKETPFYQLAAGSFAGALNRHQWRETVKKAKQQIKDQAAASAAAEAGFDMPAGGGGGPQRNRIPDEVIKLVKKEIPLRTDAASAEQMREMIALAKELDYNLVLEGVQEAWLIPGELSAAKVQTVLTPRNRRRPQPGREDSTGSSIETSAALEKAGVPFAVAPLSSSVSLDGIPGRDLTSLALEAAFAVRGGCSEQTALESLTIVPARMLGLADRLGSIEEGKDADFLILDGLPLDYHTYVDKAFVNGKLTYDRARENIYPAPAGGTRQ